MSMRVRLAIEGNMTKVRWALLEAMVHADRRAMVATRTLRETLRDGLEAWYEVDRALHMEDK